MQPFIKSKLAFFKRDTSGAVSVDWVVLTAAIVGLSISIVALFSNSTNGAAVASNENLASAINTAATVN